MKNKAFLIIVSLLVLAILLIGGTYAFFTYSRVSDEVNQLITGEIYLNYQEGANVIDLDNVFPESAEKARTRDDNYATFTITGRNTSTNKDIWYEIRLVYGDNIDGKTRLNDDSLRFDLIETTGGVKNYIFEDASFSNLNNQVIWINTVDRNTASNIERTYQLRMWLSEDITVSDTDINADYTSEDFKKLFANVKVAVIGNLKEKYMYPLLEENLEDNLTEDDGTARYIRGNVENNYVWYSGKLWRVVSLNNDNTIKLVTQNVITSMAMYKGTRTTSDPIDYTTSEVRSWLNEEFLPTLNNRDTLVAPGTWDYEMYESVETVQPTSTKTVNDKVGMLTLYDVVMSGGTTETMANSYLENGYLGATMTPSPSSNIVPFHAFWGVNMSKVIFNIHYSGYVANRVHTSPIRPVINLITTNLEITGGNGSKNSPYTINLDKPVGQENDTLNGRTSGEYVKFDNTLYRIVGIENGLTKVTMADYSVNMNSIGDSQFGTTNDAAGATFNTTSGIGKYLLDWYNGDSITAIYKNMIATDGVVWYQGPTDGIVESGVGADYTLVKTGTEISTPIGLGYYSEMFSTQFGDGSATSKFTWLMTKYNNSAGIFVDKSGTSAVTTISNYTLTSSIGVRPSFYLKSAVKIGDVDGDGRVGDGTKERPYEIVMN